MSPSAGRSDGLPVCRQTGESRCRWRKEKSIRKPLTPPQAFGYKKSHSSLGRFFHAPLRSCKKHPNEPTGLYPSGHPRLLPTEAASCPFTHKSDLCFSMGASLCFGQTKTNQLHTQRNSMSISLLNLQLVVIILSCS